MKAENEKVVENFLLWGGVIVGGYLLVIKPLMSSIGIDPASNSTVTNQGTVDPNDNPWSVQFTPFVNSFAQNGTTNGDGSSMPMSTYFQALRQAYNANPNSVTGGAFAVCQSGENLNNQLNPGMWSQLTHVTADSGAILAAFTPLSDQAQIAAVSAYYLYNFNGDLYQAMQGNLFHNGLNNSDLASLITRVNNLPANGIALPNLTSVASDNSGVTWHSIFGF